MNTLPVSSKKWLNIISLLLLLPAAWVIAVSILKYGLGISGPFDTSAPFLERMGIKEPPGWNISLLIVLGPALAILFSALQMLRIQWQFGREEARFNVFVYKKWVPLVITCFSGLILLLLAGYLAGENCNCH